MIHVGCRRDLSDPFYEEITKKNVGAILIARATKELLKM